jgi:hypothetical protein
MMHAMGAPQGPEIGVAPDPDLDALVKKYIMYHEIGETIQGDPYGSCNQQGDGVDRSENIAKHGWHCKDHKERIIFLKKGIGLLRIPGMVVFMEEPAKSMHDVFVGEPGYKFHEKITHQQNQYK